MYLCHRMNEGDAGANLLRGLRYANEYAVSLKRPVSMAADVDPVSAL